MNVCNNINTNKTTDVSAVILVFINHILDSSFIALYSTEIFLGPVNIETGAEPRTNGGACPVSIPLVLK